MTEARDEVGRLVEEARVFAALSGPFDPKQALPDAAKDDPKLLVEVASVLASGCDTNPDHSNDWLLRTSERRYILASLDRDGRLRAAITRRRSAGPDLETADLLLALEGSDTFAPGRIREDLDHSPSEQRLERIVVALDRAGEVAPGSVLLDEARSRLAKLRRDSRRQVLRERGFFGREAEKARLSAWFDEPQLQPPVRCAFLTGLPGIGKSALLEEMVSLAHDLTEGITVRLDFDRAGLTVLDVQGLTMEVARQVADRAGQFGKDLLTARLAAASVSGGEESSLGSRQSIFPEVLGRAIGDAVRQSGRPVTLVLDTIEVLRARGEQHPPALFGWIDRLVQCGFSPLHVIAAGRGEALDTCKDRVGLQIELRELDEAACRQLLDRLQVRVQDRNAVLAIAGGNPLVIRLAADIVKKFGASSLPRRQLDREVSAAFLYRFLLSRIEDPLLRRLAHPGLIVRRVSAPLLAEVIAPQLGVELGRAEAERVFEALASQHWLVARDPSDGSFVIHRSDMRLVLLDLLYRDEPALCSRINSAAVAWFGQRSDASSAIDAAYHRLQLMRTRQGAPPIGSDVLQQFDQQLIAELPRAAQDVVAQSRGGRSTLFRGAGGPAGSDDAFVRELLNLLERGDWIEGQYVVDQAAEAGGFDARSEAADAVRAFWWGAGRWSHARRLLAERDELGADDSDLGRLPPQLAEARLEMRAELSRGKLAAAIRSFGFERLENDVVSANRAIARNGALAFWTMARAETAAVGEVSGKDLNPAQAAIGLWTGEDPSYWTQAAAIARDRLAARGASRLISSLPLNPSGRGLSVLGPNAEHAPQLIASASPYLGVALNLATQQGYDWLAKAATRADERLCAAGAFMTTDPLQPLPSNPLAGIAGLGLFAEWLDAIGFISRDANLRALGRAAERWRRTVAGQWSYGRPPRRWVRFEKIDQIVASRMAWISAGPEEPVARAASVLEAWWPDVDAGQLVPLLEQRLSGVLAAAAAEPSLEAKAAALLRWNVPSAFVPPLAVLITHHAIKWEKTDER